MKRVIITASLLGGMLFQTRAQEFTLGINGAQAGFSCRLPYGQVQLKPSFGGEAGLLVRLSDHFKILTGIDIFRYQSKATLADNQVYSHNEIDDMGSAFEYRVSTVGYSETQKVTALRVPLMIQFTNGDLSRTQWYFNAGGKFVLPAKISLKASASKLTTTGYYPDVNAEVHDLPQHGFGTVNNWQSSGSYSTGAGLQLSTGAGVIFNLSPDGGPRLYAGFYTDYGVGSLQSGAAPASLVTYVGKNVAQAQANGSMGIDGARRLRLVNYGIQVKLGFGRRP